MITRTIRDTFTTDIDTIWVDDPAAFEHAQEFCRSSCRATPTASSSTTARNRCSTSTASRRRSTRFSSARCRLPYGGSIVIEQTEALVAIDVNSGNFRADHNAEETAYQMNLQAAQGDRPAAAAARPGGHHRQRLHRHARRDAPPRRREAPSRDA